MCSLNDAIIKNAVEWTLIPGMGLRTQSRVWRAAGGTAELFTMGSDDLKALGVTHEARHAIRSRSCRAAAEEIFDWARRHDCRFLVRGTEGYPALLEEIYDPPLALYARGRLQILDSPAIAIVGSRRPTVYGLQAAHEIARDLGSRGICIVSGLARGIDAAAHRGSMEGGGPTIAVLGCGIDVEYPPEHRQLKEQISGKGLVISEYPPATQPVAHNFPVRNRIISGLSIGTVVVEASEKSGSLITARMAMEQNREVFALPGNITSRTSYGTNFLIKQGAKLVQSYRDVIDEMPGALRERINSVEIKASPRCMELKLVSEEEKRLLLCLKLDEATHFDSLYHCSEMGIGELSERLINLELEGWIRRLPGNTYVRVERFPEE
ncbi:MAG: DNA-processing protein DprA [Acidobacteria bacterium]|nr:DNA-processing protein DprA [Acidobacteriota bacterium]